MPTSWMRGKFALPFGILGAGAALSVALGISAHREIDRAGQERFDAVAVNLARKVEGRFDDYVGVLTGLRARFNGAEPPTRAQFRDYVAGLNLARNYPGFRAVNYAPFITPGEKSRFEANVRNDAQLDASLAAHFGIKPAGGRDGYFPILFIEPLAGHEAALGSGPGAPPNRGNALGAARGTGGPR